jgi:hypothetical protein
MTCERPFTFSAHYRVSGEKLRQDSTRRELAVRTFLWKFILVRAGLNEIPHNIGWVPPWHA